ncbi:ATP synthase subunit C [Marimonas arenosa]|uniref:ATP synthase subunit C n=1 Tax=Marimonas arenosa TaxID=1795305 RepID=A0AAE3WGX4_9RHOB|nr:ATP synthase subunit C [Marimonas arenosa]MDQ2092190.1 ATP synthase subunit C [Marimonas arenosa]
MKPINVPVAGFILWNIVLALGAWYLLSGPALAATDAADAAAGGVAEHAGWAMIGAALSAGLAALGAAYAVAVVGSAAVGSMTEKPELMGRLLIFVGLAEGIAIYGLIVAVLILNTV